MSTAPTKAAVFIGVHLAPERVNVAVVTEDGTILVETNAPYAVLHNPITVKGRLEINPEVWWDATRLAIGQMINQLRPKVASPAQLKGICVCGDPGSLVIIDKRGTPLIPAILPEDTRATEQVVSLNYLGLEHCSKIGFKFKPEHAIAKIAWIKENLPELYETAYFAHQTDFVVGMLKGETDVTEYSLAMFTGCDLLDECWPDWLDYDMHLSVRERLPRLVPLGRPIGKVSTKASSLTGLPAGIPVVMGTTSDTASFLASGARRPGDFYTILHDGTSISGISPKLMHAPAGQIRVFKLPNRTWFFTTESRTGAGWVNAWFPDGTFAEIETQAQALLPSDYLAYPNAKKGESFPFNSGGAEGFISPATDNRVVQFASCLQGTGLFERLCYQKLDRLAEQRGTHGDIYSGGPWSACDSWMQCRADITGRVNRRMVGMAGAAFGAAMMAALGVHFPSLEDTAEAMIRVDKVFFPNPDRVGIYSDRYASFLQLMEEQGYYTDK